MTDAVTTFGDLDEQQKDAIRHHSNTVVLAGPGSGKTATLVLKVVHLLEAIVKPPQGVACITYNNDAVAEFRARLSQYGVYASRRLFLGTVHSFCLNCIIRPYGPLLSPELRRGIHVATDKSALPLLEQVAREHVPDVYFPSYPATITKIRRALACREDTSGFDDRDLKVVPAYEAKLAAKGLVDFEAMVLRALKLLEENAWIRELIAARFPWLVVDEYQDLGGPLHKIVTALVDRAGIKVFAVGDPDQTVYDFTGASPVYVRELTTRRDFRPIPLRFNYRSGGDLIIGGEAALAPDTPRGYQPRPDRKDRGRIEFRRAADDLNDHATKVVAAVQESIASGTPAHEIAIFYRRKNELLAELKEALDRAKVPYFAERETVYPRSPVGSWLQEAASWALLPQEAKTKFSELVRPYVALLEEAGRVDQGAQHLDAISRLHRALSDTTREERLGDWLLRIDSDLGIGKLIRSTRDRSPDDQDAWEQLLSETKDGTLSDHTVGVFADGGRAQGKVVVTTLHSSKGRQFDAVILPGLVEGVLPPRTWNRARRVMEEPSPAFLSEIRRLFYVGFTRARHVVYLIYSEGYTNAKGYSTRYGRSRFVKEIEERLRTGR